MQQHGFAARDQYNVSGDLYHVSGIGSLQFEDDGAETGDASSGGGFYGLLIIAIAVTIILIGVHSTSSSTNAQVDFPKTNAPWPAHSNVNLVMTPVQTWIASCAHEPLLSPEYCPQSASSSTDNVSNVHWVIHGSPSDGARIGYNNGRFYVIGHAVMTVTYDSDAGSQWQMKIIGYEAIVAWNSGHPTLASSNAVSIAEGPAVMKHNPNLPWSKVSDVIEAGFRRCAAYDVAPMPTQCPDIGNDGNSVRWQLMNNPLINARERFDPSTGLVHVTGSFVLAESYSEIFFGHQSYTWSGNYDASLSLDGSKIALLQIEEN